MERLYRLLIDLGLPADEARKICADYEQDEDGLQEYYLFMRAMYDDRHEYLD